MSQIAYFIGGPADMTKRVLSTDPPFFRIAEAPQEMLPHGPGPYSDPSRVECRTHLYRLAGRLCPKGQPPVCLYEYEGEG